MYSRRAMMTGAVGLMAATAGCTDMLGGDESVLLDLTASNQTSEEDLEARFVIQDDDGETVYNEVHELEVVDDEPSLTLEGFIEAQDGAELTLRVLLDEHDFEEVETFSIDCPADVREDGVTVNDNLFVGIAELDQIDISHNGCA